MASALASVVAWVSALVAASSSTAWEMARIAQVVKVFLNIKIYFYNSGQNAAFYMSLINWHINIHKQSLTVITNF